MNNARGDILTIRCDEAGAEKRILNQNGWILPLGDGKFRAGSTYDHDFLDEKPTEAGRLEVEEKIRHILKPAFTVTDHKSAIRPIIRRSEVMMGRHPEFEDLIYFNGLGSKGVINGPWQTLALAEHIVDGKPISDRSNIQKQFTF